MIAKSGTRALLVKAGSDVDLGGPVYYQFTTINSNRILCLDEGFGEGRDFESVFLSRNEQRALYEILKDEFGESA